MSVLYCLNPNCKQPQNTVKDRHCKCCGSNILLKKRYVAIKKIGQGGFGVTFLAVDLRNDNSYCVIKQLLTNNLDEDTSQTALALFEREAKTLAKIEHPQIPKLLNYFQDQKQFYLIQEFILGRDLEREVQKKAPFPEVLAKNFLKEILPVLDYIHSQKVIHRDIKPANILRRKEDKKLFLIDFGAVKDEVNTQLMKSNPLTAFTEISVGTMGFAPPEQLAMRPVYASDIYALGATCIFLLTGKTPKEVCDAKTGELRWEQFADVGSKFAAVLNKMLDLDLKKRYSSARQVIEALEIAPYQDQLKDAMAKRTTKIDNDSSEPTTSSGLNLEAGIRKRQQRINKFSLQSKDILNSPLPKSTSMNLTANKVIRLYSQGYRNFSQQNLSQMNFESEKLSKASFSHGKLIGVNLEKSNLYRANFYNANLAQANLRDAYLRRAELYRANLKSADLQGANLTKANLISATLKDANLCGANLTDAKVDEQELKEAKTNWQTIYPNGKRKWW